MIDFRYHLVSLIAVFLAVALGIVIGTTALNQPILSNVQNRVTALEHDKRALETRTQDLQAQVKAGNAFDDAVAPVLVNGVLAGRRVLLVVAGDQVAEGTVDDLSTLLQRAGATVTGRIRLQDGYTDPANAGKISGYVTGGGLPAGVSVPQASDAGQQVAKVLAQVLMVPAQRTALPAQTTAISSVLAGLSALDVLTEESSSVTPADYAVVLTSGAQQGDDAAQRNAPLLSLAAALDAAGSGAVVAGDTAAAADGGLVRVIRSNPAVSASVSTIDNADTPAGQISTVLALGREHQGTSGKYGTQPDTQPVPPLPGQNP